MEGFIRVPLFGPSFPRPHGPLYFLKTGTSLPQRIPFSESLLGYGTWDTLKDARVPHSSDWLPTRPLSLSERVPIPSPGLLALDPRGGHRILLQTVASLCLLGAKLEFTFLGEGEVEKNTLGKVQFFPSRKHAAGQ